MVAPLALLVVVLGAASLAPVRPARAASPPLVVAVDGVLCDLTRTLAADQARVVCVIPAGRDPHVWHDSDQAAAMVRVVEGRLTPLLPPGAAAAVKRRGQAATVVLADLGRWVERQIDTVPARSRVLVTEHRAFSSLARRFGVRELPLLDSFTTAGVLRPASLAAITTAVRDSGTRQLFAESLPISKTLRRISRASGVPVNPTPLVADGLAPGRSTVQTATGNVCTFVSGQGGRCDGSAAEGLARRWASIR